MASNNRTQTGTQPQQQQAPRQPDPFAPRQDQPPARSEPPPQQRGEQQPPPKRTLSEAIAARGIDEAVWRTLCNSIFPGALADSILMAVDYCKARQLDVLKKPCHIVPMMVTQKSFRQDGSVQEIKIWRDVILPGIYEYRITARRTGEYLGHSKPVYGDTFDCLGVKAVPEWCEMEVYRWSEKLQDKVAFPVTVYFTEVVAVSKKTGHANERWSKAPRQMLTKCTEAAALREAFPDELGGTHTDDELYGRTLDAGTEGEPRRTKPVTQAPRATNGGNAETNRHSDATGGPNRETTEPSGETTGQTGGPSSAEASGAFATEDQVAHLRKLLDQTGIPENETCQQFEVDTLEDLLFEQVSGVVAWIDRVSKG